LGQIEAKPLRKLKHPSRSRKLRSFLDNGSVSVGWPVLPAAGDGQASLLPLDASQLAICKYQICVSIVPRLLVAIGGNSVRDLKRAAPASVDDLLATHSDPQVGHLGASLFGFFLSLSIE
jgi:hypothetical protein